MLDAFARSIPEAIDPAGWPGDRFPEGTCDAVVVLLPKPLAGLGTSRQLGCLIEGLADNGVTPYYVGSPVAGAGDVLANPLVDIPASSSVAETYEECASSLTAAFEVLSRRGIRHPLVLSMGYTAFGPAAARVAWQRIRGDQLREVSVILVDSAFPDGLSDAMSDDGRPASRFFAPEYRSESGFHTYFALTSAYEYDPRVLMARLPDVLGVRVVAPPYSDRYIDDLANLGRETRAGQRIEGLSCLPESRFLLDSDIIVPLLSSDIWSADAVGAWMRPAEYKSVIVGTGSIFTALDTIAKERGCRIVVPVDRALYEAELAIEAQPLTGASEDSGVFTSYYAGLSQADHAAMIAASDLAISRTGGQANAFVVSALVGTPVVVVDMPSCGYMQAEMTSAFVTNTVRVESDGEVIQMPSSDPLGWIVPWDSPVDRMAQELGSAIASSQVDRGRARSASDAFYSLRGSERGSLFTIVSDALTGATSA